MPNPPLLRYAFARQHGVAFRQDEPLRLLVREGAGLRGLGEARRLAGQSFEIEPVSRAAFDRALGDIYASAGLEAANAAGASYETGDRLASLVDGLPQTADLLDAESDAPIIRLINGLISEAIRMKASDIHVEPFEDRLAIRFRIDGQLREVLSPEARLASPLVSRIKVMARLDIAEKRLPQDGRMSLSLGAKAVDVRVSTLPARHGERVVMRLLDKEQALFSLSDLGMAPAQEDALAAALAVPNGIILVTGPTGSGKTTTLYACLQRLNATHANILTVEDPIEYGLDGVGQTQVNPKVGMTFAAGLRAILRQDPDIVMVGEIRDGETAQIAVQASLTGHLVLTTIHTNSAAAAVMRLKDMGVEPFLLASTLQAVLAQRLVRRLCPHCKQGYAPTDAECGVLGVEPKPDLIIYRAVGCEACVNTGYAGRLGLYELLQVTPRLRDLIHDGAREAALEAEAFRQSDTLLQSGARHVLAGETSLEDVLRVCRSEGPIDARL